MFAAAAAQATPSLGEDLIVLGALFVLAYILGRAGKLIGLPAVPIYIIVGLLASPHTGFFPINLDADYIDLIAIFGLVLLLFNLGLEFDQDEFFGNFGKLIVSGGFYVVLNLGVGFAFGMMVGWGPREAMIIAGMVGTSSSAIITKLLIELNRLPNAETPAILGVSVVGDVFIAIYLAFVSVVLSGQTDLAAIIIQLTVAFSFLVAMFAIARYGGRVVSRLFRTKDDELFTILFFGFTLLFAGIGELIGVSDAIGAFLIGLVLAATRHSAKVERIAEPLRDVFAAFFFLNFGLTLNIAEFPGVSGIVLIAVGMTIVLNVICGIVTAWLNKLGIRQAVNISVILMNRGEFTLILATLSLAAGLDKRLEPFAGLYVLIMAIVGPVLSAQSERIGALFTRPEKNKRKAPKLNTNAEEAIALVEAATSKPDADTERKQP